MHRSATDSFLQENPSRYPYPDSQIQTDRFQKQTDVLRFIDKKKRKCFYSNNLSSLDVLIVLHLKQMMHIPDFVQNVVYLGKN